MKKLKNEFKFLNTPKFSYEYENEVNVLGRKLVHIGEGIYIFEIPFTSDELIEGVGFQDLDVRCKLLFQNINESDDTNSQGFRRYDVTYIMDEKYI